MPLSRDQDSDAEWSNPWRLVQFTLGLPLFFALFLFLPAGTWAWERGWLFVVVFTATISLSAVWLWFVNPAIYAARSRFREGTKRWDRILLCFLFPPMIAIFPVAALDDGRFHWLSVPWWAVGVGYLMFVAAFSVTAWAQAVNKFFEPTVRIQTDRGHQVIDTGPYAIVRHPGYIAAVLLLAGIALSLGSLWALVPVAISSAIIVLRTHWEDETLQAELPGYQEYTERVRCKLIPGVW